MRAVVSGIVVVAAFVACNTGAHFDPNQACQTVTFEPASGTCFGTIYVEGACSVSIPGLTDPSTALPGGNPISVAEYWCSQGDSTSVLLHPAAGNDVCTVVFGGLSYTVTFRDCRVADGGPTTIVVGAPTSPSDAAVGWGD